MPAPRPRLGHMLPFASGTYTGLDLAAESTKTGLAEVLVTAAGEFRVESVSVGVHDAAVVEAAGTATKVGVDVPVGWPGPFVELITAHTSGTAHTPPSSDKQWRRQFVYRATDLWAQENFGLRPLSVSADLIAHPALRWVALEAQLRERAIPCTRDGAEKICEVYPAGALQQWSIPHRGYKGTSEKARQQRSTIMAALENRFDLKWGGCAQLLREKDDALDAVIAALVAAHVHAGHAYGPPEQLRKTAQQEGWLWLPAGDVDKQ